MSTEITASNKSLPAAVSALTSIGQNAMATTGSLGTGDAFGRFTKDGAWIFGQEEMVIEDGAEWALNPLSLRHGHIGWPDEGRPTEVTVPMTDPLPEQPTDSGLDWNNTMAWQAKCLTGEDAGQQVLFKGGSIGFLKATTQVAQKIAQRAQAGESELVPVVTLGGSHYQHKKFGRINTPTVDVVRWVGLSDTEDDQPTAEEPAQEPEPVEEPKKAAPARRRRVRK